jgi:putative ABC transport system permease protein
MAMRAGDVAALALSALARHKVRTALTVLGVAIGTFTLVVSLAVGLGVDRAIVGLFRGTAALRQVVVGVEYTSAPAEGEGAPPEPPVEGEMSDAKRARIRRALAEMGPSRGVARPKRKLDAEGLAALARMPHVERVLPHASISGRAYPPGPDLDPERCQDAWITSVGPDADYAGRLVAGRAFSPGDSRAVVVHELLLYRWGITSDAQVAAALGATIRLEHQPVAVDGFTLERLLSYGPEGFEPGQSRALVRMLRRLAPLVRLAPLPADEREAFARLVGRTAGEPAEPPTAPAAYHGDYTIVGVVRGRDPDAPQPITPAGHWYGEALAILPPHEAEAFYLRDPGNAEFGFSQAVVIADDQEHVRELAEAIGAMGYSQYSLAQMIATIRLNVTMITLAVAFVAVVAMTVAALGITNTMIMSVLERTHEIGIMKALGAREGQIRGIFLVEGACIGVVGGLLGLLAAWAFAIPGDAVARSIMQAQTPRPIEESLFAFTPWLTAGAPAMAAIVTTLAAVYPAHRAAWVDPVTSLRHE